MEKERPSPDDGVKSQLNSLQDQISRLEKIGKESDDSSMQKINQLVQDVKKTTYAKEEDYLDDDMSKISKI